MGVYSGVQQHQRSLENSRSSYLQVGLTTLGRVGLQQDTVAAHAGRVVRHVLAHIG